MSIVKIHEFDPVIYPFKLWVCCTDNYKTLNTRFYSSEKQDLDITPIYDNEGVTYYVKERCYMGHYGCLVVFTRKEYFNIKLMAHEAAHVCDYLWEHVNEGEVGDEANAYFMGWVVDSMDKARKHKNKKNL